MFNCRIVETRVVKLSDISLDQREILNRFTREELRYYARSIGVKTGRNKCDTINNIIYSPKATLLVQLGN